MGATGNGVAWETADVVLMTDDRSRIPSYCRVKPPDASYHSENLWYALGVVLFLLSVALLGWAGIGVAIVLHEGSALLVVGKALWLLRFRGDTLIASE